MTDQQIMDFCFKHSFAEEAQFLASVRAALVNETSVTVPKGLTLPFNPACSQVYLTLFQRGLKPIRWGTRKAELQTTLQHLVNKIKTLKAYPNFNVADPKQCRILFEMVIEERDCSIRNLTGLEFCKNRFEPGVTGFKFTYQGVVRYFMPTDAVVHSIMSVPQLLNHLAKKSGIAKRTNNVTELGQLMRSEPIEYKFINSIAFVSYEERVLPLFRGYPVPVKLDKSIILDGILKSIDWMLDNMNEDGSFLYYYDSYLDSKVDFDHPKMIDPLYNNILRHSGGTITLLRGYELTGEQKYLNAAQKSLGFLLSTVREHEVDHAYACYPFDNKKSKLGGAGIGLVSLMHYYQHTQDESYRKVIDGMVRHILSRVDDAGEMIGYYIHPLFNDGQPLINPSDEVKKQLFSFYYPGEALLGLALYYRHINNIDNDLKNEVYIKSRQALDFLVDVRPVKYHDLFTPLPADAWLMQAIEEWVKVEGFQKQSYIDFVFNDALAMFDHMYNETNSPEFDYIGGFYYHYGDHVYHDASRNEGVVAAYYLAKYLGDEPRAEYIMQNMLRSALGLMYTRHTPESTYAHKYPEKSLYSFRFKLTRQWVRVDSVQHAACFFSRLYMALHESDLSQTAEQSKNLKIAKHKKNTLSISMIVKNEASHIARVLENAWLFADEIIVVDTGSTDDTVKIAESMGATIYYFEWCQDFAKARNASLSYCTKDFVLWLDADDVLEREDALRLNELLHNDMPWDVIYLPYYYHSDPKNKTKGMRKKPPRIFRNHIGISWISPIHESLSYPRKVIKNQSIDNINIYHQPLRESTANALRNLNIMFRAASEPENLGTSYHLWHIAKEYNNLKNQRLAIEYFKKALQQGNHPLESPFRRSRLYYGLGKQYKRLKEYASAIEAYSLCAINYNLWREPFVSIAACYQELGAYDLALVYLSVAEKIPRHSLQIEVAEYYEGGELGQMRVNLLKKISSHSGIKGPDFESQTNKFKFIAGGDVCLARQLPDYTLVKGEARAFESLRKLTENSDVFLVNLECVVSNVGKITPKTGKRPFFYRGNPIVLDILVDAGINAVTTANNHSMDYGHDALLEQNELLSACHIAHPGSGRSLEDAACAQFIAAGDTTIGLISIDTETPEFGVQSGKAGTNASKNYEDAERRLLAAIAHAKRFADLIVVSPHWGANWLDSPSKERKALAHALIDAGADLILGHSAHIFQGIEVYKGRAIVYDMGTLLFDRVSESRMAFSALFELEFTRDAFSKLVIHPIKLQRARATIANEQDSNYIRELFQTLSTSEDPSIKFAQLAETLELTLGNYYKVNLHKKTIEPECLYKKANLTRLPRHYFQRPNTSQINSLPAQLTNNKTIVLNNGLSFIGCNSPALVKIGYGFVVQMYFKTVNNIAGHWELVIIGRLKSAPNVVFEYSHPFTEGVYPIGMWKPNILVCDEFVARPPRSLKEGEYQLYWKIYNKDTQETLYSSDSNPKTDEFLFADIFISAKAKDQIAGLEFLK